MENVQAEYAPFWGHIEELRRTFLRILAVISIGVLVCFYFYDPLIKLLTTPLEKAQHSFTSLHEERIEYRRVTNTHSTPIQITLPHTDQAHLSLSGGILKKNDAYEIQPGGWLVFSRSTDFHPLVILSPLEGFLTALKTSLWVGIVGSSPIWLWLCLRFISPALHGHEKRLIVPFILMSLVFIALGCAFTFFLTLPLANAYFIAFNQSIGINLWSLSHYMDYTIFLMLANGLSFELGVIGLFLVHLKMITSETLVRQRRLAILSAFIIGALLTPPDILTQLMLAIPLIFLYEGLILYSSFLKNRMGRIRLRRAG